MRIFEENVAIERNGVERDFRPIGVRGVRNGFFSQAKKTQNNTDLLNMEVKTVSLIVFLLLNIVY